MSLDEALGYLEDPDVVLLVDPQEVAVVLPQDDGGGPRRVVQQRQLAEVLPLAQLRHQTLRTARCRRSAGRE